MPRKRGHANRGKKTAQGSRDGPKSGDPVQGSHVQNVHTPVQNVHKPVHLSKERENAFQSLEEMFRQTLDADVIHMVLAECDWKVEVALESLITLSGSGPQQSIQREDEQSTLSGIASSLFTYPTRFDNPPNDLNTPRHYTGQRHEDFEESDDDDDDGHYDDFDLGTRSEMMLHQISVGDNHNVVPPIGLDLEARDEMMLDQISDSIGVSDDHRVVPPIGSFGNNSLEDIDDTPVLDGVNPHTIPALGLELHMPPDLTRNDSSNLPDLTNLCPAGEDFIGAAASSTDNQSESPKGFAKSIQMADTYEKLARSSNYYLYDFEEINSANSFFTEEERNPGDLEQRSDESPVLDLYESGPFHELLAPPPADLEKKLGDTIPRPLEFDPEKDGALEYAASPIDPIDSPTDKTLSLPADEPQPEVKSLPVNTSVLPVTQSDIVPGDLEVMTDIQPQVKNHESELNALGPGDINQSEVVNDSADTRGLDNNCSEKPDNGLADLLNTNKEDKAMLTGDVVNGTEVKDSLGLEQKPSDMSESEVIDMCNDFDEILAAAAAAEKACSDNEDSDCKDKDETEKKLVHAYAYSSTSSSKEESPEPVGGDTGRKICRKKKRRKDEALKVVYSGSEEEDFSRDGLVNRMVGAREFLKSNLESSAVVENTGALNFEENLGRTVEVEALCQRMLGFRSVLKTQATESEKKDSDLTVGAGEHSDSEMLKTFDVDEMCELKSLSQSDSESSDSIQRKNWPDILDIPNLSPKPIATISADIADRIPELEIMEYNLETIDESAELSDGTEECFTQKGSIRRFITLEKIELPPKVQRTADIFAREDDLRKEVPKVEVGDNGNAVNQSDSLSSHDEFESEDRCVYVVRDDVQDVPEQAGGEKSVVHDDSTDMTEPDVETDEASACSELVAENKIEEGHETFEHDETADIPDVPSVQGVEQTIKQLLGIEPVNSNSTDNQLPPHPAISLEVTEVDIPIQDAPTEGTLSGSNADPEVVIKNMLGMQVNADDQSASIISEKMTDPVYNKEIDLQSSPIERDSSADSDIKKLLGITAPFVKESPPKLSDESNSETVSPKGGVIKSQSNLSIDAKEFVPTFPMQNIIHNPPDIFPSPTLRQAGSSDLPGMPPGYVTPKMIPGRSGPTELPITRPPLAKPFYQPPGMPGYQNLPVAPVGFQTGVYFHSNEAIISQPQGRGRGRGQRGGRKSKLAANFNQVSYPEQPLSVPPGFSYGTSMPTMQPDLSRYERQRSQPLDVESVENDRSKCEDLHLGKFDQTNQQDQYKPRMSRDTQTDFSAKLKKHQPRSDQGNNFEQSYPKQSSNRREQDILSPRRGASNHKPEENKARSSHQSPSKDHRAQEGLGRGRGRLQSPTKDYQGQPKPISQDRGRGRLLSPSKDPRTQEKPIGQDRGRGRQFEENRSFAAMAAKSATSPSHWQPADNKSKSQRLPAHDGSTRTSHSQQSPHRDNPGQIVRRHLENGQKVLVMMRGCPGSGKTTLARQLKFNGVILSTDDFFVSDAGQYYYEPDKLDDAHNWNHKRAADKMKEGVSPIIIDNTNSQSWEMKPYVIKGKRHNYQVEIIEPNTRWKFKAGELARRCSHKVPKDKIQRMVDRYDRSMTVEKIMNGMDKPRNRGPQEEDTVESQPKPKKSRVKEKPQPETKDSKSKPCPQNRFALLENDVSADSESYSSDEEKERTDDSDMQTSDEINSADDDRSSPKFGVVMEDKEQTPYDECLESLTGDLENDGDKISRMENLDVRDIFQGHEVSVESSDEFKSAESDIEIDSVRVREDFQALKTGAERFKDLETVGKPIGEDNLVSENETVLNESLVAEEESTPHRFLNTDEVQKQSDKNADIFLEKDIDVLPDTATLHGANEITEGNKDVSALQKTNFTESNVTAPTIEKGATPPKGLGATATGKKSGTSWASWGSPSTKGSKVSKNVKSSGHDLTSAGENQPYFWSDAPGILHLKDTEKDPVQEKDINTDSSQDEKPCNEVVVQTCENVWDEPQARRERRQRSREDDRPNSPRLAGGSCEAADSVIRINQTESSDLCDSEIVESILAHTIKGTEDQRSPSDDASQKGPDLCADLSSSIEAPTPEESSLELTDNTENVTEVGNPVCEESFESEFDQALCSQRDSMFDQTLGTELISTNNFDPTPKFFDSSDTEKGSVSMNEENAAMPSSLQVHTDVEADTGSNSDITSKAGSNVEIETDIKSDSLIKVCSNYTYVENIVKRETSSGENSFSDIDNETNVLLAMKPDIKIEPDLIGELSVGLMKKIKVEKEEGVGGPLVGLLKNVKVEKEEEVEASEGVDQSVIVSDEKEGISESEVLGESKIRIEKELVENGKSETLSTVGACAGGTIVLSLRELCRMSVEVDKESQEESQTNITQEELRPSTPRRKLKSQKLKLTPKQKYVEEMKKDIAAIGSSLPQDWALPDFLTTKISDKVDLGSSKAEIEQEKKEFIDTGTFTCSHDFVLLYKVQKNLSCDLSDVTVIECSDGLSLRISSSSSGGISQPNSVPCSPKKRTSFLLDKSCSTDEIMIPASVEVDLEFLESCFPTVSKNDLQVILDYCGKDVEWASNLLLDSGYEYNSPEMTKERAKSEGRDDDKDVDTAQENNLDMISLPKSLEKVHLKTDPEVNTEINLYGLDKAAVCESETCRQPDGLAALSQNVLTDSNWLNSWGSLGGYDMPMPGDFNFDVADLPFEVTFTSLPSQQTAVNSEQTLEQVHAMVNNDSIGISDPRCPIATSDLDLDQIDNVEIKTSHKADGVSNFFGLAPTNDVPDPPAFVIDSFSAHERANAQPPLQVSTPLREENRYQRIIDTVTGTQDRQNIEPVVYMPFSGIRKLKTAHDYSSDQSKQDESDASFVTADMSRSRDANVSPSDTKDEEGKEDWTNEECGVSLHLSPEMALGLQEMFGPVGFHVNAESLCPDDLKINLSYNMARLLHEAWAKTLEEKFVKEETAIDEMLKSDAELARQLQNEEDAMHHVTKIITMPKKVSAVSGHMSPLRSRSPSKAGRSPKTRRKYSDAPSSGITFKEDLPMFQPRSSSPCTGLQQIMDEEIAIKKKREEEKKQLASSASHVTMATRMKQQKLYEMFPGLEESVLDEIFESCGNALGPTVSAIRGSTEENPQSVFTASNLSDYDDILVREAEVESLNKKYFGNDESSTYQKYEDPDYQDYRAEASLHYRLRHECFQKAQEAHRKGMKQVATFYSQQGHMHKEKIKAANRRASDRILDGRSSKLQQSNTLDLHGLHVSEALEALEDILTQRQNENVDRPDKKKVHLYVVTGRGAHSKGGIARIKPAVVSYLNRNGYRYSEPQIGMLRVNVNQFAQ